MTSVAGKASDRGGAPAARLSVAPRRGRPPATSSADLRRIALRLFVANGS